MPHLNFESMMTEYVLGELTGEDLTDFRLHIDGCEECSINLASLKKVLKIYGSAPFDMPSEAYFASLVPQIRERLEERESIFSRFNFFFSTRWAGAVAVVFVAAVSTLIIFNLQNGVPDEAAQGEDIYYSGALQTEIYTVAAISETFDSEEWNILSGIIDEEIGEYRNLFNYESEEYYPVDLLSKEEWEEFYERFNNQQIL